MPTFDPPVLTSWTGWPDVLSGPYVLVLRWCLVDDGQRIECVGVGVQTYADDSLPGVQHWLGNRVDEAGTAAISTDVWRSVRVREVIDRERQALADQLTASDPEWAAIWRRPEPRGLVLTRGDHRAVAEIYLAAAKANESPRKAVAESLQISPSAAAKRIARAREHGLIPATTRGRASRSTK